MRQLRDMDEDHWRRFSVEHAAYQARQWQRIVQCLRALRDVDEPWDFDQLHHSLQMADRVQRAGGSDEMVLAALCHDMGKVVGYQCHGEIAASMLRPYVSDDVFHIVRTHQDFECHHIAQHAPHLARQRDRYRFEPWYRAAVDFSEHDQASFDADAKPPPLEHFLPLVEALCKTPSGRFAKPPRASAPAAHDRRAGFEVARIDGARGLTLIGDGKTALGDVDAGAVAELFHEGAFVKLTSFAHTNAEFRRFTEKFAPRFHEYVGATHARALVDGVTSHLLVPRAWQGTGVPAHAETTYMARPPSVLWFTCVTPPPSAGETVVFDGVHIWNALSSRARSLFEKQRIRYTQAYPETMWREIFKTDDLDEVLRVNAHNGVEARADTSGVERGGVRKVLTAFTCRAVHTSRFGEIAFVNHLLPTLNSIRKGGVFATQMDVKFEDGSAIPDDVVDELFQVTEQWARPLAWRPGEVIMIDNTRVMHGARSYFGFREVHLRMTADPGPVLGYPDPPWDWERTASSAAAPPRSLSEQPARSTTSP